MTSDSHLSIWFFVGILLTFYGLIIVGAGIYNLVAPPANPWVLYSLHADTALPLSVKSGTSRGLRMAEPPPVPHQSFHKLFAAYFSTTSTQDSQ